MSGLRVSRSRPLRMTHSMTPADAAEVGATPQDVGRRHRGRRPGAGHRGGVLRADRARGRRSVEVSNPSSRRRTSRRASVRGARPGRLRHRREAQRGARGGDRGLLRDRGDLGCRDGRCPAGGGGQGEHGTYRGACERATASQTVTSGALLAGVHLLSLRRSGEPVHGCGDPAADEAASTVGEARRHGRGQDADLPNAAPPSLGCVLELLMRCADARVRWPGSNADHRTQLPFPGEGTAACVAPRSARPVDELRPLSPGWRRVGRRTATCAHASTGRPVAHPSAGDLRGDHGRGDCLAAPDWPLGRGAPGRLPHGPGRSDWEVRAVAALLYLGPGSALFGRSAAFAWGLVDAPGEVIRAVLAKTRRVTEGRRRAAGSLCGLAGSRWPAARASSPSSSPTSSCHAAGPAGPTVSPARLLHQTTLGSLTPDLWPRALRAPARREPGPAHATPPHEQQLTSDRRSAGGEAGDPVTRRAG